MAVFGFIGTIGKAIVDGLGQLDWKAILDTVLTSVGGIFASVAKLVGGFFKGIIIVIVALSPFILTVGVGFGLYCLVKFIICKIKKKPFTLFVKFRNKRKIKKEYKELQIKKIEDEIEKSKKSE